jgi:hypothetical protein
LFHPACGFLVSPEVVTACTGIRTVEVFPRSQLAGTTQGTPSRREGTPVTRAVKELVTLEAHGGFGSCVDLEVEDVGSGVVANRIKLTASRGDSAEVEVGHHDPD